MTRMEQKRVHKIRLLSIAVMVITLACIPACCTAPMHPAGTPEEAMISRLALRSMRQARYSVECTGHFGLACPFYCHFTSPIRRYPDLQIHRIIKEQLRGRLGEERIAHYREILPEVAKHSSETERRADEAERETEKLKKVEYMEGHVGDRKSVV